MEARLSLRVVEKRTRCRRWSETAANKGAMSQLLLTEVGVTRKCGRVLASEIEGGLLHLLRGSPEVHRIRDADRLGSALAGL